MNTKHILSFMLLGFVLLNLHGCGSEDDSDDTSTQTVPSGATTINGVAMDGYLQGAKVCLDINLNNICDADEPSDITDADGRFSISVDEVNTTLYPLLLEATAGVTIDNDTGETINKSFTLTTPSGDKNIISPLTTLVKEKMDFNASLNQDTATQQIATLLNLGDSSLVFKDYIAIENTALHQVAQAITFLYADMQNKAKNINADTLAKKEALDYLIHTTLIEDIPAIVTKVQNNEQLDLTTLADANPIDTNTLNTTMNALNAQGNISSWFANKQFYNITTNDTEAVLEKIVFDANFSSLSWEQLTGNQEVGSANITDVGLKSFNVTSSENGVSYNTKITLLGVENDYLHVVLQEGNITNPPERWYFDKQKAEQYYFDITGNPIINLIPEKTIGTLSDWDDVAVIHSDPAGDAQLEALDVLEIKMAQDTDNFYILIKRATNTLPPDDLYSYGFGITFIDVTNPQSGNGLLQVLNGLYNNGDVLFQIFSKPLTEYYDTLTFNGTNYIHMVVPKTYVPSTDSVYQVYTTSGKTSLTGGNDISEVGDNNENEFFFVKFK